MARFDANGKKDFITKDFKGDLITIYVDGDYGGGDLNIFASAGTIQAQVVDGGTFNETNVDSFGNPKKRIVIAGRAEKITLELSGATNPDLVVEVI
ncbi:MAG: hypothetical protein COB56_01050 [Robiginitomaculum sp.]|nr:MAG: hypothetical protein COB56_01050 [Robiginitomaculum sp.]